MKNHSGNGRREDALYATRAGIGRAFANRVHLKILDLICKRGCTAAELHRQLGIAEANLSQHLAVLKAPGMMVTSRAGKSVTAVWRSPKKKACSLIVDVLRVQVKNGARLRVLKGGHWLYA